jgi:hypothetical protein
MSRVTLAAVIGVFAAGVAGYHLVRAGGLGQTAALFIALPATLAFTLVLTVRPRTATGMIMLMITVALLLSGVLVGEGIICIVMASPLAYLVGLLVGLSVDAARRHRGRRAPMAIVMPALLLAGLEGVTPYTSLPREGVVSAARTVAADPAGIERALAATPAFDRPRPAFLRMGFPEPVGTGGSGLAVGDRRVIRFAGEHGPGEMILVVTARGPGRVTFGIVRDTALGYWLRLHSAEVTWASAGPGRTRVRWTLRYRRLLDPGWYFGPMESYGLGQAAGYLIETLAVPR